MNTKISYKIPVISVLIVLSLPAMCYIIFSVKYKKSNYTLATINDTQQIISSRNTDSISSTQENLTNSNNRIENFVMVGSDTTGVSIDTIVPKTNTLVKRYTSIGSTEKRPTIADNIQNESSIKNQIWEILDTYYQINESSKCDQLVNFFTPVVDNYFDKANQSITQIVNDCIKYHSRWPYQEINLDKSSLQIGILQNGDYSVHYNLFYKVKQQLNDNWKSFYLTTTIGLTPDLKIRSINESRN